MIQQSIAVTYYPSPATPHFSPRYGMVSVVTVCPCLLFYMLRYSCHTLFWLHFIVCQSHEWCLVEWWYLIALIPYYFSAATTATTIILLPTTTSPTCVSLQRISPPWAICIWWVETRIMAIRPRGTSHPAWGAASGRMVIRMMVSRDAKHSHVSLDWPITNAYRLLLSCILPTQSNIDAQTFLTVYPLALHTPSYLSLSNNMKSLQYGGWLASSGVQEVTVVYADLIVKRSHRWSRGWRGHRPALDYIPRRESLMITGSGASHTSRM